VFSDSQKQEMVKKLTDTMVSIEGENMRQVTWVEFEESEERRLGVAGHHSRPRDVWPCSRQIIMTRRIGELLPACKESIYRPIG